MKKRFNDLTESERAEWRQRLYATHPERREGWDKRELVFNLRQEGKTWVVIGKQLGVSATRAGQMFKKRAWLLQQGYTRP